jgi:hypothetical protein
MTRKRGNEDHGLAQINDSGSRDPLLDFVTFVVLKNGNIFQKKIKKFARAKKIIHKFPQKQLPENKS